MAWGKYQKRPKVLPKCANGCWPHETGTMIYSATFTGMVYYCRVCRNAVTPLDRMRPKLRLVQSPTGGTSQ